MDEKVKDILRRALKLSLNPGELTPTDIGELALQWSLHQNVGLVQALEIRDIVFRLVA